MPEEVSDDGADALTARAGYDAVAKEYGDWHWTRFWRMNEAPIVRAWLADLPNGFGLDAGTGFGPYRADIIRQHHYAAVDLSWKMLGGGAGCTPVDAASNRIQGDVRALPFLGGTFDWILSTRVLSHVPNPELVLAEFGRVAKPGAPCLITDVHPAHPYERVSIRTADGRVPIETYKHRLSDLLETIEHAPHWN
jgi:SAM-dependent methyltransferase